MPLSLNVSHSKKVGLPNYGSQGACCSLGIELDGSLLRNDPKKFRHEVREAFIACREAVLARDPQTVNAHTATSVLYVDPAE